MQHPLISFCLFAYNQEPFIREAVEGALAQTYSPLEIILSDDCSTDRTFDIMQQMLTDYKGSHKIILNRNDTNLGLAAHVNKVFSLAQGELFIMAAGDDVSLPQRTERIVTAWTLHDKVPSVISSSHCLIERTGRKIRNVILGSAGLITVNEESLFSLPNPVAEYAGCGAVLAYSRKIYDIFGDLEDRVIAEDQILLRRGSLIGKILAIQDVLVNYRLGGLSTEIKYENYLNSIQWPLNVSLQILQDLQKIEKVSTIQSSVLNQLKIIVRKQFEDSQVTLIWKGNIFQRLYALARLICLKKIKMFPVRRVRPYLAIALRPKFMYHKK
jgi:glycosyltransferase involved in cell wall biosynthesis